MSDIPEAADEYDCMISPPDDMRDRELAERLTAWWERRRAATAR